MEKLVIAAIQMCSGDNRNKNLDTARILMEKAVQKGAQLIALPENFSFIGQERENITFAEEGEAGKILKFFKSFSSKHRTAIIGGSIPLKSAKKPKITNTCLVFDQSGQLTGSYDKIHLFDFQLDDKTVYSESHYAEPGERIATVNLFGHIMGLSICYDLRFPELFRKMMLQGMKILFVPAAFTMETGRDHWEILLRARAIENQCYVVAPAQYGRHNDERVSYGRTMIIDPWGRIMAQCQDKEDIIVCEIDFEFLDKVRKRLPCLKHIRHELFFSSDA
ncbi:MAG: carbon-nitrogen hydrolase family protein [Candidatus Kuenenia sp.]|nr:carbon-nitrogen hydrolase family protein [Candidatus Kuenenia hertensis]